MLRSILAVIAGFLVIMLAVILTIELAARLVLGGSSMDPTLQPTTPYLVLNLVFSFLSALFGGYVTARIAPRSPLRHAQALAAVMLVMGVLSALQPQPGQPGWYPYVLVVLGPVGAWVGGLLRT